MHVEPPVRTWLQLEGLAALVTGTVVYRQGGDSWWLYAGLFFVPDASFLGYLAGPRVGAVAYNLSHTYAVPLLLIAATRLGLAGLAGTPASAVALIWIAHIGFDRMMGYGLKYASSFHDTHLGPIGPRRRDGA